MRKLKLNSISNEDEFRKYSIYLLQKNGFKVSSVREGAGPDGGRDIEAVTFEYDSALKEKVSVTWWVELKYRANSNLGVKDFNDIKNKITNAHLRHIDKFLLITNVKLSLQLTENLSIISNDESIKLRIWDKDFIENIIDKKQCSDSDTEKHKTVNYQIIDREDYSLKAINLINSTLINVLLMHGPRGIGKSYLVKFVAQYMHEIEHYVYGSIDCAYYSEIGRQIKTLAGFLKQQGCISDFTETISIQKNENERIDMLCEHIKIYPTILIFDNFEYVLSSDGKIKSSPLKRLLDVFASYKSQKSILIITSRRDNLNATFVEAICYKKMEIQGWDIDYILKKCIAKYKNIYNQLEEKGYSYEKQKTLLSVLNGNPYAYNVFNQLCLNTDIEKLFSLLENREDIPQFLIQQFALEVPENQKNALECIAQFSRPLTKTEIISFICDEDILDILILKGLIEKSVTAKQDYALHPLTSLEFNLDKDSLKRKQCVNSLITKIDKFLIDKNIDESYYHDLSRQKLNMYLNISEYEKAQQVLIEIGTRILSMGDIVYLQSVLNLLFDSDLNDMLKNRLNKIKAHIESYTDDLETAKNTYQIMLDKAVEFNDSWAKSAALNGLGSMSRYVYDYDNAISKYQESLAIRLLNNMEFESSNSYHNIGATYIIMKEYDSAVDALNKAKNIREKYNDKFRLSATMLYLGECYMLKEDFTEANKILCECHKIKIEINDKVGEIWSVIALAKLYILSKDIDNSKGIYDKLKDAEASASSLKLYRHLVLIRMYLGIFCYLGNQMFGALEYYNKAMSICKNIRKELFEHDIQQLNILAVTSENLTEKEWSILLNIVKHHKI